MPSITHKNPFGEPKNYSVKYIVYATALIATLSSGCKDQKLIDDYQKLTAENERLKVELAENTKQKSRQELLLENLGVEINKINKNSEAEAERFRAEILSLKGEIELKKKKIEEISKDNAIRKESESLQLNIVNDAMLYLESEEFAVREEFDKTLYESRGQKKIEQEREVYCYWDFKFDPSKKTLSWNSLTSTFKNTHYFFSEVSIGYQIASARRHVLDLTSFSGAIPVESITVCEKTKTKLKLNGKLTATAHFFFEKPLWKTKIFENPSHKTFSLSEVDWKIIDPPYVDLGCEFVMDNEKAARFKAALEAIIKANGGKISGF